MNKTVEVFTGVGITLNNNYTVQNGIIDEIRIDPANVIENPEIVDETVVDGLVTHASCNRGQEIN